MSHRIVKLVCINAILFAMTVSAVARSEFRALTLPTAQQRTPDRRTGEIFVFHTDEFWLNLHHFLYVLGRAQNKVRDSSREAVSGASDDQELGLAKLKTDEQRIWREAVAAYAAGPSKKDLVFDEPMPALTTALASAGNLKTLNGRGVDPAIAAILERAAPTYRKAWWQEHLDANNNWQKVVQGLVDRHGDAVLKFITKAYQLPWPPAGFPLHVSGFSNWAGAYSTTGNLLVIASMAPGNQGAYGLESIFHEGMHQWDEQLEAALREQAKKVNKIAPRNLDHALIFFTAGEAVRRVVPDHVPTAEKFGVWRRGMEPLKLPIEEIWKPYLDGKGTRDEAFAELIKRTAIEPPKN